MIGPDRDSIRLLLVGAACDALRRAAAMAAAAGAQVATADGIDAALAILRGTGVALIMIDVGCDVAAFMAQLRIERFVVPVLACGIDAPADRAVAAIRAGARDYVTLPPDPELIAAAIGAVAMPHVAEPVGTDPGFRHAIDYAHGIAQGRLPVLLSGESGTGKALMARQIHDASRRHGRLLSVECSGVAPEIVESELFGHGAGQVPGVAAGRSGKIEQAGGGTLFIRDIDRLSAATQGRLAAMLTNGAHGPDDIRLIASTGTDLSRMVAAGSFRGDLLDRLGAAHIHLPALRDRPGDIAVLATHFAARAARSEGLPPRALAPDTLTLLLDHGWPGNIRELEAVIARATVIAGGPVIGPDDLVLVDGTRLSRPKGIGDARVDALVGRTVEEVERALILRTLETCHGNRTSASGILGISVRTMRNKLKTFVEAGIAVAPAA